MVGARPRPYRLFVTSRCQVVADGACSQLTELRRRHPGWLIGWCEVSGMWLALPSDSAPRLHPPWVDAADLDRLDELLARAHTAT